MPHIMADERNGILRAPIGFDFLLRLRALQLNKPYLLLGFARFLVLLEINEQKKQISNA